MENKKNIVFIVNPISGIKAKMNALDLIQDELSSDFNYSIETTERPKHATEITKEAVKNKFDAVIVVGGDGSINEIGKALVNTKVAMGILPFGSGNGFARHLKIPLQARKALQLIKRYRIKKIDTGLVNKKPFFATAGMGFDAKVSRKFASFGKRGMLSYSQITFNEFFNYKPKEYRLMIDGEEISSQALTITFANVGQWGNNAWIAPHASVFDGYLDVCILEPFPVHLAPDIALKMFNKKIDTSKYYHHFKAKEIEVLSRRKYHVDGEPKRKGKKMIVKVNPKSLHVIC